MTFYNYTFFWSPMRFHQESQPRSQPVSWQFPDGDQVVLSEMSRQAHLPFIGGKDIVERDSYSHNNLDFYPQMPNIYLC